MDWFKQHQKLVGAVVFYWQGGYSALVGFIQEGPAMLLNLGWPLYAMASLFGLFVGSMLLWSWSHPYRPVMRLHRLWPEISGLHAMLEIAIRFEEEGQFRHCEKTLAYLLPELDKLKIRPGLSPDITEGNAKKWEAYLLGLAVAAKVKQIRKARALSPDK